MLKDTLKSIAIHPYDKQTRGSDILSALKIFGKVEVWAYKNKTELIHYDNGSNIVTVWGKHAMIGLMSGVTHGKHAYAPTGASPTNVNFRDTNQTYSASVNTDGSVFTGGQYFTVHSATAYPGDLGYPSEAADGGAYSADYKYPLYPTKMLFGTGKEFSQYAAATDSYGFEDTWTTGTEDVMLETSYNWTDVSANFNTKISDNNNYYSGLIASADGSIVKAKTVNDVYAGPIATAPNDSTTVLSGAIKNGLYTNTASEPGTGLIDDVANGSRLPDSHKGVGRPSFIYFDRSSAINRSLSSNISTVVDSSTSWSNQLAYSIVMPDQLDITENDATDFYPYNGYTLKQAGLFSDALFTPEEEEAVGAPSLSGDALKQYNQMQAGTLWAVRNISPVQKTRDVEITIRWSLYYTL